MAPGCPDRLVPPAAARTKELAPIPARQIAGAARRPDLSAPFTVMLMTGLMSAGLFLSVVVQRGVPLERVLPLAVADPFGAMALVLIAAAGVMARIGVKEIRVEGTPHVIRKMKSEHIAIEWQRVIDVLDVQHHV